MSETNVEVKKNRSWMFIVAAFIVLAAVGVITS